MIDLIEELKDKNFTKGEDLEAESLIIAQKVLHNMGLGLIPQSYADFLKHYNGIKYDGCYLFGATVDDDLDIIDKNQQMQKPENMLLLGYNEFDLLCFDYVAKQYLIIDRADFEVLYTFTEDERDYAISRILSF